MKMRPILSQTASLFLILVISLPSPLFALHTEAPREIPSVITGLEEKLRQPNLPMKIPPISISQPIAGLEEPRIVPLDKNYAVEHAAQLAEVDSGDPIWAHGPNWGPDRFSMDRRPSTGTALKDVWNLSFAAEDKAGNPVAYLYGTAGQPDYPIGQEYPGLFLFRLRVRWDHAGRRLAPWLILKAAQAAKERGLGPNVALETPEGNNHARHVFEMIGFQNKGKRLDSRTGVRFVQYAAPLERVILGSEGLVQQRYPDSLYATLRERIGSWQSNSIQTGLRFHQASWSAKQGRVSNDDFNRFLDGSKEETPASLKIKLKTGALLINEIFVEEQFEEGDLPIFMAVLHRYNDLIAQELGDSLDYPTLEWALGIPKDSGRDYVVWLRGVTTAFETILQRAQTLFAISSSGGLLGGSLAMLGLGGHVGINPPLAELVANLTHADPQERDRAFQTLQMFIGLAGFSAASGTDLNLLLPNVVGVRLSAEEIADLVDPLQKLLSYRQEDSSKKGLSLEEIRVRTQTQALLASIAESGAASDRLAATIPLIESNLEQVFTGEIFGADQTPAYNAAVDALVESSIEALVNYAGVSSTPTRVAVGLRVMRFLENYGRAPDPVQSAVLRLYDLVARKPLYPRSAYLSAYQQWGPSEPQESQISTRQLMLPEVNMVQHLAVNKEVLKALGNSSPDTIVLDNLLARDAGDLLFKMAAEEGPERALILLDLLNRRRVEIAVNKVPQTDWYQPFPDQSTVNIRIAAGLEELPDNEIEEVLQTLDRIADGSLVSQRLGKEPLGMEHLVRISLNDKAYSAYFERRNDGGYQSVFIPVRDKSTPHQLAKVLHDRKRKDVLFTPFVVRNQEARSDLRWALKNIRGILERTTGLDVTRHLSVKSDLPASSEEAYIHVLAVDLEHVTVEVTYSLIGDPLLIRIKTREEPTDEFYSRVFTQEDIAPDAGLEENSLAVSANSEAMRIQRELEKTYGSPEGMRQSLRAFREIAQTQQQGVAIFFDSSLVAGGNPLEKAMHLAKLDGNLRRAVDRPDPLPITFELSSPTQISRKRSEGYRIIKIIPEPGRSGTLTDQGILLHAADALRAAVERRVNPDEIFPFYIDPQLYQAFGELDYPTFVVTLQELIRAA